MKIKAQIIEVKERQEKRREKCRRQGWTRLPGGLRCGLFRREQIDGQIAEVTRRLYYEGRLFSNSWRARARISACFLLRRTSRTHSLCVFPRLNAPSYFLNDSVQGSIVTAAFAFRLACAPCSKSGQERNLNVNALVALVACFPRVNWWDMQRRMQMTSTVIADCHGNICMAGTQSIRTEERADRRARKKRIERGRERRGGGVRKKGRKEGEK